MRQGPRRIRPSDRHVGRHGGLVGDPRPDRAGGGRLGARVQDGREPARRGHLLRRRRRGRGRLPREPELGVGQASCRSSSSARTTCTPPTRRSRCASPRAPRSAGGRGATAMPAEQVDGNDVFAVYQSARRAVEPAVASGQGPRLPRMPDVPLARARRACWTTRSGLSHPRRDRGLEATRPDEAGARGRSSALGVAGRRDAIARFEAESDAELAKAVAQGQARRRGRILSDLFRNLLSRRCDAQVLAGDRGGPRAGHGARPERLRGRDRRRRSQGGLRDHRAAIERFGAKRVFDVPNAENALTGIAIGAAAMGKRPVVVHPRNDFMFLAADQMINLAAKWRYMYQRRLRGADRGAGDRRQGLGTGRDALAEPARRSSGTSPGCTW